jgi:hypothetical protein
MGLNNVTHHDIMPCMGEVCSHDPTDRANPHDGYFWFIFHDLSLLVSLPRDRFDIKATIR